MQKKKRALAGPFFHTINKKGQKKVQGLLMQAEHGCQEDERRTRVVSGCRRWKIDGRAREKKPLTHKASSFQTKRKGVINAWKGKRGTNCSVIEVGVGDLSRSEAGEGGLDECPRRNRQGTPSGNRGR